MGSYKYKAFISYSHADTRWARWLHRSLEAYRIPRAVDAPDMWSLPVFRDREELAAADSLSGAIREALADSETLVVVCSPAAAASAWVCEEIREFIALGRRERILCLLVDGDPDSPVTECLPEPLRGLGEPLAADVRPNGDGRQLALLKLVAGITEIDLGRLRDRDAMRRNRRLLQVALGSVAGMIVTVGLAIAAYLAEGEARRQTALAEEALEFSLDFFDAANPTVAKRSDVTAREMLENGVERIAALSNQPEMQAKMLSAVAEIYYDLGEFERSRTMVEDAIELETSLYGSSDRRTLEDRVLYGQVLTRLSQYELAEPVVRASAADAETAFGPGDSLTLSARGALAIWYLDSGSLEQARDELGSIYTTKLQHLGARDVSSVRTATNLVVVYQRSGLLEEAAALAADNLAIARQVLPRTDPLTLGLINNLAACRLTEKNYGEARDLYAEHLAITQEIYGEENLATSRSKGNLALAHQGIGDFESARLLQEEAIAQQLALLGDEHPITLRSRGNFVGLLIELARFDEAIEVAEDVVAIQRRRFGATHFETLYARLALGHALARAERENAAAYLDALEPVLIEELGPDHQHVRSLAEIKGSLRASD